MYRQLIVRVIVEILVLDRVDCREDKPYIRGAWNFYYVQHISEKLIKYFSDLWQPFSLRKR